jgi:Pyruvate/2-oxoacid:ferredoxin oxidoreductase delta subunit
MSGAARGNVTIDVEEGKGCGLCVESCPTKCVWNLLPS